MSTLLLPDIRTATGKSNVDFLEYRYAAVKCRAQIREWADRLISNTNTTVVLATIVSIAGKIGCTHKSLGSACDQADKQGQRARLNSGTQRDAGARAGEPG